MRLRAARGIPRGRTRGTGANILHTKKLHFKISSDGDCRMAIRDAHTTERNHAQTDKLTDGRTDDWSPKPTGRPLMSLRVQWDWDGIANAMRDDALLRFYFTIFSYAPSNCYKPTYMQIREKYILYWKGYFKYEHNVVKNSSYKNKTISGNPRKITKRRKLFVKFHSFKKQTETNSSTRGTLYKRFVDFFFLVPRRICFISYFYEKL